MIERCTLYFFGYGSQDEPLVPSKQVIIIGGGLSGIAAAVGLTMYGYQVKLIESRPRLGGRASSIADPTTGELIDNCQHVNMGCCTSFQNLCRLTNTDGFLTTEQQLHFIGPDGKVNILKNGFLPAPAHLAYSFAKLSYLNWKEKLSLAKALLKLKRATGPASGAFADWLKTQRQSQNLIDRFWNVVLVSALSEDLDRIDFYHARKVFLDGFLQDRNAWKVQLLKIPLGEFYDEHLQSWLINRGAEIKLKTGLKEFLVEQNMNNEPVVAGVKLRDGSTLKADHYLLAVSFDRANSLLPVEVTGSAEFSQIEKIESAPITSVHLWFNEPITNLRHAVFIDRLSQWVFNRNAILEREFTLPRSEISVELPIEKAGYYYQVVISNSRDVKERVSGTQQQLIAHVIQELKEIWPDAASVKLLHARVITEHRAVFSVTPGIEKLRPPQQTPIRNLQIAGDWTKTGWPSTMESAVRSGFLAAENIAKNDTRAEQEAGAQYIITRILNN